MKEWVKESRDKYNKKMRAEANKKAKKAVDYREGDLVSLREERYQGTGKKIKLPYEGPYRVVSVEGSNEYTIQKVGEGIKLKMRVHADRLITYNDVMELDKRKVLVEAAEDEEKEVHVVEKVI